MDVDTKKTIRSLARRVRRSCREMFYYEVKPRSSGGSYDMMGSCALCSYMLKELAARHDIDLNLKVSYVHCWLEYQEGIVVDPTYCQYNINIPVYIGKPTKRHDAAYPDTRTLMEWDYSQNPFYPDNLHKIQAWVKEQ